MLFSITVLQTDNKRISAYTEKQPIKIACYYWKITENLYILILTIISDRYEIKQYSLLELYHQL